MWPSAAGTFPRRLRGSRHSLRRSLKHHLARAKPLRMEAECQCGQLRVSVPGPTVAVVACHCIACQRRTGSPFGVAAYYPDAEVIVSGLSRRFERPTALGATLENFFCPDCGSTVYFRGSKNAGVTGVPIGAFVDHHAMSPIRSVWEQSRHAWVTISTATQTFEQGRP